MYQPEQKKRSGCVTVLIIMAVLAVLGIGGCVIVGVGIGKAVSDSEKKTQEMVDGLATATPSSIRPDGTIKEKFSLMSEYTDIQRENAEKEFKGQIVEWTLTVFEVKAEGKNYKIQTESDNNVGTFIELHPRSDQERAHIEALKTGSSITVRGYIEGTLLRNVQIEPAILIR